MDGFLQSVLAGEAFLLFDGAMGTMLQRRGLAGGGPAELLCLSDPEAITDIHRAYVEAGSQAVTTNTFGANRLLLDGVARVDEVFEAAVACARKSGARFVAADIGPTGELLDPLGDLEVEEAREVFGEMVDAAEAAGADLVIVETMADPQEAEAAVSAAKERCSLPVFATMTFGNGGRTLFGTAPADAARLLEGAGADAVGVNCSLGPDSLGPIVDEIRAATELPIIVQANAGLPSVVGGETVYSVDVESYVSAVAGLLDAGASIIGGCCGTDPDYIRALSAMLEGCSPRR